jgi:hypothetical protein
MIGDNFTELSLSSQKIDSYNRMLGSYKLLEAIALLPPKTPVKVAKLLVFPTQILHQYQIKVELDILVSRLCLLSAKSKVQSELENDL